MSNYAIYILYALVFITVLLVVEGVYFLISTGTQTERAANKRMKLIQDTGDPTSGIIFLRKSQQKNTGGPLSNLFSAIQHILWAGNSSLSVPGFFIIAAILVGLSFMLLTMLGPSFPPLTAFLSLLAGFGIPFLWFKRKAAKRHQLFTEQLCPAIDLVARGLQAGHPAAVALEMVSKEMPDPIGTEFGLAIDEMNYGLDRAASLRNMVRRFPSPDLQFFVSALEVQKETGGNLVEVLNNLSNIIRSRRAMRKKVWAMSAEGRVTCLVVGALPFVIMAIISLLNPDFYTEYAGDRLFQIGMAIPAVLYALGMYWIWKMINIKI